MVPLNLGQLMGAGQLRTRDMEEQWPKTLEEAVKVHLLTMTDKEKEMVRNTPEEDLINFHFSWGLHIRNEFGLWAGNSELIKSCGEFEPDGASSAIIDEVGRVLQAAERGESD